MRPTLRWLMLAASLACLFLLGILTGCGGFTSNLNLQDPVERPGENGSVAGTVFSLAKSTPTGSNYIVDYPYQATVELTPINPDGSERTDVAGVPDPVLTTFSGTYRFDSVPAGLYKATATAQSSALPGITVSNTISHVLVRAGLPTMMANILIGDPTEMATFTGIVRMNGQPVEGATVGIDVAATDSVVTTVDIIITTTTDADGRYTLTVPDHARFYVLSAHSDQSTVYEGDDMVPPFTPENLNQDIELTAIANPITTGHVLQLVATTIPAPTKSAAEQALVTKLAVARQLNAPASRIADLEAQAVTGGLTRGVATYIGMIENELTWTPVQQMLTDIQGYYIYRSNALDAAYTKIGTVNDPFQTTFADCDPALSFNTPSFYTVTGYAAHGAISAPAAPAQTSPLPVITGIKEDVTDPETVTLSWDPVPTARGYILLVFDGGTDAAETGAPTFNNQALIYRSGLTPSETSFPINHHPTFEGEIPDLQPDHNYWWAVAAYNVDTAQDHALFATAATYAPYRKFHTPL